MYPACGRWFHWPMHRQIQPCPFPTPSERTRTPSGHGHRFPGFRWRTSQPKRPPYCLSRSCPVRYPPDTWDRSGCPQQEFWAGRILRAAVRHDIALVCMHTNADCAQGGVNDALAAALFLTNVGNLEAGENGMLGRVGDLPKEMAPREFALYVKECQT